MEKASNYEQLSKDGKTKITVETELQISKEDIDDIMSAALEGGITYWADSAEVGPEGFLGEYASENISRGGILIIHDAEDDVEHTLTLDKLIGGIKLFISNGLAPNGMVWAGEIDTCQVDGEAADAIVQLALFGEVVYG